LHVGRIRFRTRHPSEFEQINESNCKVI
jgi:hypothetical protein